MDGVLGIKLAGGREDGVSGSYRMMGGWMGFGAANW